MKNHSLLNWFNSAKFEFPNKIRRNKILYKLNFKLKWQLK